MHADEAIEFVKSLNLTTPELQETIDTWWSKKAGLSLNLLHALQNELLLRTKGDPQWTP